MVSLPGSPLGTPFFSGLCRPNTNCFGVVEAGTNRLHDPYPTAPPKKGAMKQPHELARGLLSRGGL